MHKTIKLALTAATPVLLLAGCSDFLKGAKLTNNPNLPTQATTNQLFVGVEVAVMAQYENYPIMLFMPTDEAAAGLRQLTLDLQRKGAVVFATGHEATTEGRLPALPPDHPDADAVALIQSFYATSVRIAERRGTDVDRPRHLQKVTRTR